QRILAAGKEARGGRPPVAVEVAPVRKAAIRDIGRFTGSLLPKSQFTVAPKVAGRLERLLVDVGDSVKRGQVVARLDDEEFAQELEGARAELQVARAGVENCSSDLEVAKREFERASALREKKVASESELDAAQAHYRACEARHKVAVALVKMREASSKAAEVRLSYMEIQAWWEKGDEPRVIGERFVHEGAQLMANQPIVTVLEDHVLIGVVHVIERDYPKIRLGQQTTITTDAWPGKTFTGRVVRIAPLLKETSRQGQVEVEIPNPDRPLKTGMFIRAQIEFARQEAATVVDVKALVKRNGKEGVFLADAEQAKARFVPVTVGIIDGELAEVSDPPLSGLVVTLGQNLLEDGSPIALPGAAPGGGLSSQAGDKPRTRPARGGRE
ncbi:MAG: hypothetical protein AMJ81_10925, partial [Phycisphaerae bacterium SM23_33]